MDKVSRMLLFVDVVNCRSYTKAADKRHITRSVISKQISKLETEVGARLFHRTTRSLSLTEIGRVVYHQALKFREHLEETEILVERYQQTVQGLLRITCPSHFGILHVQPVVCRFMQDYPDVQIELSFENRYTDIVAEGIDLAVRITHPQDSNLIALKLADNPVKMVASPEYLNQYQEPQQMEDLKRHRCIVYAAEGVLVDHWQYYENETVRTVQVNPIYLANDGNLLLEATKAGMGIGLLATFMLKQALQNKELVPVLPAIQLAPYSPIYVMYSSREHLPPKTEIFLKYLKAAIQKKPYWEVA